MKKEEKKLKIAFVVGVFPVISETFIINQIADLLDRGVEVEIFYFNRGAKENISQRFYNHKMENLSYCLDMPKNVFLRLILAIPKIIKILFLKPSAFFRVLNFKKYGREAFSLKLLYWSEPFLNKKFDLVHCHFGPIANKYLIIKHILNLEQKIITTFYGYDVSHIFEIKPDNYYDKLKKECPLFLVMSEDMKKRIILKGFDENKIRVLPISIDVNSYPFKERNLKENELTKIVSVGRFVEKKGFDDLLRALAIVKNKTDKKFVCHIIGDGPLKSQLYSMTKNLGLEDVVSYRGYMKLEDIIKYFLDMHFYLQPSKTAPNGDME
jgi:colanic acid/amylovoran biosynthesis glycosyltransferase